MPNPKQPKMPVFPIGEDVPDQNTLTAKPLVMPFGQEINPFKDGLRMGALGAAAGVGLAGIQRAIRLRAGDATPVSVYKPMALGAVIGAALGGIGSYRLYKKIEGNQPYAQPQTWEDLADRLEENSEVTNKYAGLRHVVKSAQEASMGWEAAKIPMYFIPGLGTAVTAGDALSSTGRSIKNLFHGNLRGAASEGLGAVGNAALALGTLFTGGTNLLGGIAKGTKRIANIGRLASLARGSREARQAARLATGRFGGLMRMMSPAAARLESTPGVMSTLERGRRMVEPLRPYRNKLNWGGFGLNIGGGLMGTGEAAEGMPGPGRIKAKLPHRTAGISDQAMPQFEVPNVQY